LKVLSFPTTFSVLKASLALVFSRGNTPKSLNRAMFAPARAASKYPLPSLQTPFRRRIGALMEIDASVKNKAEALYEPPSQEYSVVNKCFLMTWSSGKSLGRALDAPNTLAIQTARITKIFIRMDIRYSSHKALCQLSLFILLSTSYIKTRLKNYNFFTVNQENKRESSTRAHSDVVSFVSLPNSLANFYEKAWDSPKSLGFEPLAD